MHASAVRSAATNTHKAALVSYSQPQQRRSNSTFNWGNKMEGREGADDRSHGAAPHRAQSMQNKTFRPERSGKLFKVLYGL